MAQNTPSRFDTNAASANGNDAEKGNVHHTEHAGYAGSPIHLTNAQYERLFFQPGGAPQTGAPKQLAFGNPTSFAMASYLLSLTPTVCMLMQWDGAAPTSFPAIVGVFYFVGGLGMTIGGVFEWVLGNTFPFVVFSTFGGFWLSLAVLSDPSKQIASAFTDGSNTPTYNHGLQFYFIFWVILAIVYFIASLRTNIVFAYLFFTLILLLSFLAAAYRQTGLGNANLSLIYLKAAGAFGFANCVGAWYLTAGLIFAAVDMPFNLPFGDLSGFLSRRKVD